MPPIRVRKRSQYKYFNATKFLDGTGNSLALGGCKSFKQTSQDLIDAATTEELVVFHSSTRANLYLILATENKSTYHAF